MAPMMLCASAVLAAALATDASGASVLVSRTTEVSDEGALEYAQLVEAELKRAGISLRQPAGSAASEARGCQSDRACLGALAARQGARVAVTLELARLLDDFAAHVELVRAADGALLADVDIVGPAKDAQALLSRQLLPLLEEARAASEPAAKGREVERPPPPPPPPPEPGPAVRLSMAGWGFLDLYGRSMGGGLSAGAASARLDVGARVVGGERIGLGLEAGYLLREGGLAPRVGLRASAYPAAGAFGGGPVAGLRATLGGGFSLLADLGLELHAAAEQYHPVAVTLTVGVSADLVAFGGSTP